MCKLTCRRVSEALQIINKAVEIFNKADPNTERNSKVQIDVLASVRVLFKNTERKMKGSQKSLDFYLKMAKESVTPELQQLTSGHHKLSSYLV